MSHLAVFGTCLFLLSASLALGATEKPKPLPEVLIRKIKSTELFDTLVYPARVLSRINAAVLSENDGVVGRIHAPLGQNVKRRQSLMTIKNTDPVYRFAAVAVASPVGGVVSDVSVTEGSRVIKGQLLATVTDPSKLRIQVEVAASDLSSFSPGLRGDFRSVGNSSTIPVRVIGVSPLVDPATGTASCEVEFDSPSRVPPGTIGQVSFRANLHKGFTIPEHALVYKDKDTFVRIVDAESKAKKVAVQLGRSQSGFVEITKGISEGDTVVERTSGFVADGEIVKTESATP